MQRASDNPINGTNTASGGDWVAEHDPVGFLRDAIRCVTINPPGGEGELAQLLQNRLEAHGVETDLRTTEEGRPNLTATLRMPRPGPRLVLSGHLDTVPLGESAWRHAPFDGAIEGGLMYGRGTADMKGGLLALMFAVLRVQAESRDSLCGELVFAATFGEETGSDGARRMVEDGQLTPFDALVVAEPTANAPVTSHKGAFWLKVSATGQTAHSSAPDQGINAITLIHRFQAELMKLDLPGDAKGFATLAVTRIEGGRGNNVIPDACSMTIDVRTLPGQSHEALLDRLRVLAQDVVRQGPGGELRVTPIVDLPGVATPPEALVVRAALAALDEMGDAEQELQSANYFTDASVFQEIGGDVLILGPGRPDQAHQTDENIEIKEYLRSVDIYCGIIRKLLMAQPD